MSPTSCQLLYSASWWGEVDSNHRRRCQQIYSLLPLATRESPHKAASGLVSGGADDGTRTRNLLITNQLLYQLSYIGTACDDYYIIRPWRWQDFLRLFLADPPRLERSCYLRLRAL